MITEATFQSSQYSLLTELDSLPGDRYPAHVVGGTSGGEEGFTGRAAIGYDHGYDGQISTSGWHSTLPISRDG